MGSKDESNGSISASITQDTLDASVQYQTANGTGASGGLHHQHGLGGAAALTGQLGLLDSPDQKAVVWAQHQRTLDRNFTPVGPATNSVGVNYNHIDGTNAFASASKTGNFPATGAVGGTIPIARSNDGNTVFGVMGQSNFGGGMKPNHSGSLVFRHNF